MLFGGGGGGGGGMGAAFLLGEGETVSANFEMDGFLHTLFLGTETQTEAEMFTAVFLYIVGKEKPTCVIV